MKQIKFTKVYMYFPQDKWHIVFGCIKGVHDDLINLCSVSGGVHLGGFTNAPIVTVNGFEEDMESLIDHAKILGYTFYELTTEEYIEWEREVYRGGSN